LLLVSGPATSTPLPQDPAAVQEAPEPPRLTAARARVRTLQAELDRLASQRQTLVGEFETADVELALRREQLRVLEQRSDLLAHELERQTTQVGTLEATLQQAREALAIRVAALYRIGPLSYNRLLLTAGTTDDVLVAYQLVTYLADRDRGLVREVRQTLDDLDGARSSLQETAGQLSRLREEVVSVADQLEAQQGARRERLRLIDVASEDTRVALAEAEKAAVELASTLTRLADASSSAGGAGFSAARGQLPWPAVGDVVGGFGRQRHPIYDTYTVSRGIEIGAPEGDPATAVFGGRVAFADWYSGYGLLVIVDHGGEYFTLYGHLREVEVRVGDRVQAGGLVGRVGETASLTGPNLYFEVREGTDALNPLQWLERSQ
jgi:septal ring factor EnvC (AmiA/AmiB activator)